MCLAGATLVTLYLEGIAFHRAADTASLLELFAEGFEGVGVLGNPCNDRDGLATSSFGLSPDTHHAITACTRPRIAADTFDQLTLALGAQPASVGAVNGLTVAMSGQRALLQTLRSFYTSTRNGSA